MCTWGVKVFLFILLLHSNIHILSDIPLLCSDMHTSYGLPKYRETDIFMSQIFVSDLTFSSVLLLLWVSL
jgi:hypothetical protein